MYMYISSFHFHYATIEANGMGQIINDRLTENKDGAVIQKIQKYVNEPIMLCHFYNNF